MTAHSLDYPKIPASGIPDMQWVLDDLLQSELMLMGLYTDSTEEDLLAIYSQYPSGLLLDLLQEFTSQEQYTHCDAIRQLIAEREAMDGTPLMA